MGKFEIIILTSAITVACVLASLYLQYKTQVDATLQNIE